MTWRPSTTRYVAPRLLTQRQFNFARINDENREAFRQFREDLLTKVGRLIPKHKMQLLVEIDSVWGDVGEQRVRRALRVMVADGLVRRTSDGYLRTNARAA